MSEEVGALAVTIKMGRVAMLMPMVMFLTIRTSSSESERKNIQVPWYLLGFLMAAAMHSLSSPANIFGFPKMLSDSPGIFKRWRHKKSGTDIDPFHRRV